MRCKVTGRYGELEKQKYPGYGCVTIPSKKSFGTARIVDSRIYEWMEYFKQAVCFFCRRDNTEFSVVFSFGEQPFQTYSRQQCVSGIGTVAGSGAGVSVQRKSGPLLSTLIAGYFGGCYQAFTGGKWRTISHCFHETGAGILSDSSGDRVVAIGTALSEFEVGSADRIVSSGEHNGFSTLYVDPF